MRSSPSCRGDLRSGCGRSGGGGGGGCDDGGGGDGGGDGKGEGVEVLATTVTGRRRRRGRRFVVVVVVIGSSSSSTSSGGSGGGSGAVATNDSGSGRRTELPCRERANELARVRASYARTFSFEACARARERVCRWYRPARASKEFTIEQHGGTPSKCLNGRIVHYHPSVAG